MLQEISQGITSKFETLQAVRGELLICGYFSLFVVLLLLCSLMRDLAVLFIHLITTIARLAGPGGARSVVAESVLVKAATPDPESFPATVTQSARLRSPHRRLVCSSPAPKSTDPFGNRIEAGNALGPPSGAEKAEVPATVLA